MLNVFPVFCFVSVCVCAFNQDFLLELVWYLRLLQLFALHWVQPTSCLGSRHIYPNSMISIDNCSFYKRKLLY